MLDINLTASLLKTIPPECQILSIGDSDQLPSVGAGNVLRDIKKDAIPYETELTIPQKFQHVNLDKVKMAKGSVEELLSVLKKVHPWSSLHYGLMASEVAVVRKLYMKWIPQYFGEKTEIQILSPMTRGSLGTLSLNKMIQESSNLQQKGKGQLTVGERIFRVGDV